MKQQLLAVRSSQVTCSNDKQEIDSMMLKPQFLSLMGVSLFATAAVTIGVQAAPELLPVTDTSIQANEAIRSHTVQGTITATGAETASVPCNQIKVKAEIWSNVNTHTVEIEEEELGSTTAKGSLLGNGCTYTLTFNYSPSRQLPKSSQYRFSAETPTITGQYGELTAGYTDIVSHPFPTQFDMKL
jgi:hypothetical protein